MIDSRDSQVYKQVEHLLDLYSGNCTESQAIGYRTLLLDVVALLSAAARHTPTIYECANAIRDKCYMDAAVAGWWRVPAYGETLSNRTDDIRSYPPHILRWWAGTKLALIHSEVSEALEGLRKDKMDDHLPHLKSIDVELADAVIRIMDLCGGLGIDIGLAITEKLAYNAKRADHKPESREAVGGKTF